MAGVMISWHSNVLIPPAGAAGMESRMRAKPASVGGRCRRHPWLRRRKTVSNATWRDGAARRRSNGRNGLDIPAGRIAISRTVKIPAPLIIHRDDLDRGVFHALDVNVRAAGYTALDRCPSHLWRPTRVRMTIETEKRIKQLTTDEGRRRPEYQIIAAALFAIAFDRMAATYGRRQIVVIDGAIDWTSPADFIRSPDSMPAGRARTPNDMAVAPSEGSDPDIDSFDVFGAGVAPSPSQGLAPADGTDLDALARLLATRCSPKELHAWIAVTGAEWTATPITQPGQRAALRRGQHVLEAAEAYRASQSNQARAAAESDTRMRNELAQLAALTASLAPPSPTIPPPATVDPAPAIDDETVLDSGQNSLDDDGDLDLEIVFDG